MIKWLRRTKPEVKSGLQSLLQQWEQQTLIGSDYCHHQKYSLASEHFQQAELIAFKACQSFPESSEFLNYYTLSSLNLAYACQCQALDLRTEQVLADAHFNMTAVMLDSDKPMGMRQLARQQAEALLNSLSQFLGKIGRDHVADDLQEEFGRLSCF